MGTAIRKDPEAKDGQGGTWKLEDAKARFSEVVRRAQSEGPQRVTVRGRETVAVISVEELERLLPTDGSKPAFVPFLEGLVLVSIGRRPNIEGLGLDGLDLEREMDRGRDILL